MTNITKYIRLFKQDYSGTISTVFSFLRRDFGPYLYFYVNFWLRLKGCKLSGFVRFWGFPLVIRYPNSIIEIGEGVSFVSSSYSNYRGVSHKCIINTGAEGALIKIGDNCGFSGCSIVANREVKIGKNVNVGADTIIGDRDDHSNIYSSEPKPVIIDDNVWIGMHCIILKGVHIGENTIIGAGSVVTKDIPSNCIAAGVPCKVIKKRL